MIFLETERLVLRRFVEGDEEHLVALDADPEVMRFLTGGAPHAPHVIRDETLPRMLRLDAEYGGRLGYWAAEEKGRGGASSAGSSCGPRTAMGVSASSATGCAGTPGAGVTPPRAPVPWSGRRSPNSASSGSSRRPWPSTGARGA